jgi:hypothetical protein
VKIENGKLGESLLEIEVPIEDLDRG